MEWRILLSCIFLSLVTSVPVPVGIKDPTAKPEVHMHAQCIQLSASYDVYIRVRRKQLALLFSIMHAVTYVYVSSINQSISQYHF